MRKFVSLFLLAAAGAVAHVGSPDVFYEGQAGPYKLLVTIRTPTVIPGVANIEIRSASNNVDKLLIVPTPLTGPAANRPPVADVAQRSKDDPQYFTGALWIMGSGSWRVLVTAQGAQGEGKLSVPVPALASSTKTMQGPIGFVLALLGLVLVVGAISIVGAGVREGQLEPGLEPDAKRKRRARWTMAVTAVLVVTLVFFGNVWWTAEASSYDRYIFKPLDMSASLQAERLVLHLSDPGWLRWRKVDDLIPDHNHLMHLYVISLPDMDKVWHLHPDLGEPGTFTKDLPAMPAGKYALYADIVHENGLPETLVTQTDLPEIAGKPLEGDDAAGTGPPVSSADFNRTVAVLPDGYHMTWVRDPGPLHAKRAMFFHFLLTDPQGKPVNDAQLYMGMQGHAAFVATDRSVFAHVHPSGSVPMASLGLTQNAAPESGMAMGGMSMPGMDHSMMSQALPPEVSFPFGLPKPGNYRIYVQVKRGGTIETGVFDAHAEN